LSLKKVYSKEIFFTSFFIQKGFLKVCKITP
jgi:hypothetical protein